MRFTDQGHIRGIHTSLFPRNIEFLSSHVRLLLSSRFVNLLWLIWKPNRLCQMRLSSCGKQLLTALIYKSYSCIRNVGTALYKFRNFDKTSRSFCCHGCMIILRRNRARRIWKNNLTVTNSSHLLIIFSSFIYFVFDGKINILRSIKIEDSWQTGYTIKIFTMSLT